jgi:hypothetical protein
MVFFFYLKICVALSATAVFEVHHQEDKLCIKIHLLG